MKKTGIHAVAQHLQRQGRGKDTILAHIMPEEAAMLKRMGGSGTINPKTGLLEFSGADDSGSSVTSSNYGGSSGASSGLSGFGGGSSSPGGVDSGGNTNPTVGGGGGGGGGSSGGTAIRTGNGGGGMLTASTPSVTSSGGGNWTPSAGNSSSNYLQSLGVPTIVANTLQTAGQTLLNFSDAANAQYQQMMADPSAYLSSMLPSTPSMASPESAAAAAESESNVDPLTGRDYDREATQRAITWGEALGSGIASLRDVLSAPQEATPTTPGFRSEAASGGYDFTPDYTGTTQDADALRNQMLSQEVDRMWNITPDKQGDWGPTPTGFDVTAEDINRQIMTPTGVAITPTTSVPVVDASQERSIMDQIMSSTSPRISVPQITIPSYLGAEENRSPTEQTVPAPETSINPYGFTNIQTALLPGTLYGPVTSFGVTPGETIPGAPIEGQSNINMDKLVQALKNWAPQSTKDMTDQQIRDQLASAMPEGITLDPKTGVLINTTGLTVDEAIQQLGDWKTKWFNSDVPISQFVAPRFSPSIVSPSESNFGVATGPSFTAMDSSNIAQNLENEFSSLTKSANLAEVPTSSTAINLPTFAQVPVGSPMAYPEAAPAAPAMTYPGQPAAPDGMIGYTTERLSNTPASLRDAISNPSLYYGMGYPSLVNMPNPTPAGVAAMLANIERESSYDPTAYYPKEDAFGFAQYQRTRLPAFLAAMGINEANLPADKDARAAAIRQALANTDTQQIGYMLNEIATTKAYAPTYNALTQPGVSPSQAATTYMRNFEGAQMEPNRVAAQAANAERIARTQFAGTTLSPTVTQSVQASGLTSPQTTQEAIKTGELGTVLDAGWKQVMSALYPNSESDLPVEYSSTAANDLFADTELTTPWSGNGGGGGNTFYSIYRTPSIYPAQKLPVEEPAAPVYTTGMSLTPQTYAPSAPVETLSPAYP